MEKYKINRKLITVTCDLCGKEFQKPLSEYNRNVKLGRHNFCSRSCTIKYCRTLNTPLSSLQREARENIKNYSSNRKDEYTPFRELLRRARNRFKECNLDLPYLKDLWESQEGKCSYTYLNLVLPIWNKTLDKRYEASLDRIDSSKGYIKGNVQFVATPINYLKNTMSHEETKAYLKEIATSIFMKD